MANPRPKHHFRALFFSSPDACGRAHGSTQAWHKTAWSGSPYCIPNELISAQIGQFLKLPIPPFAITYSEDNDYYFSSLDFNFDRDQLPPVEPDLCWEHLPRLCSGVMLFDILIANEDRHDENLVIDNVIKPSFMRVFDHDQALFGGGGNLAGTNRLTQLHDRLGVSGGVITGGNRPLFIGRHRLS